LLNRVENVADVVGEFSWPEQQMGMLGHDDIRPNVEAVLWASPVNRIDQPLSTSILAQECLPTKARECKGMGLAGGVVSLASLSIIHCSLML